MHKTLGFCQLFVGKISFPNAVRLFNTFTKSCRPLTTCAHPPLPLWMSHAAKRSYRLTLRLTRLRLIPVILHKMRDLKGFLIFCTDSENQMFMAYGTSTMRASHLKVLSHSLKLYARCKRASRLLWKSLYLQLDCWIAI